MSVVDAARRLAQRMPGGIAAQADRLGKTATTLRHQLANFAGYRLSLGDAELITQFAIEQRVDNPLEIINAMAASCGAVVVPLPGMYEGAGSTMEDLADAAKEFAEFVTAAATAAADGHVTENELREVQRELSHLIGKGQRVVASLDAIHRRGKPVHTGGLSEVPPSVRAAA